MGTTELIDLSPTVCYGVRGQLAVLRMSNPPVNGLSNTTRTGLAAGLGLAEADEAVQGVVVVGEDRGFCGGADIRQFGTPASTAQPNLVELFALIQSLGKPVAAAIHGFALGGGFELALVCNYRIAQQGSSLGLPEVKIGLLPGVGGTQRLSRLIGAERALDLIQYGASVDTAQAAELGLIDLSVPGDPLEAAVEFLEEKIAAQEQPPVIDKIGRAVVGNADFVAARQRIRPNAANRTAQLAAIEAVMAATTLPIQDGLALERASFLRLVDGDESKALRHVFFAEKEAAKATHIDASVIPRPVDRIAVIGAGTMGSGIAMACANAGYRVDLIEQEAAALGRGMGMIQRNYASTASKGRLTAGQVQARLALITPGVDMKVLRHADLVIEAVFEDMHVKKAVFATLDALCKPGAVMATNTSRLDVNHIARSTSRPQDVIGLHFFSPAHVMKLLEVVGGDDVAEDVVLTGLALARKLGKIPVLSKVCDGFIGNRMLGAYRREADFLLEEGSTPEAVDGALQAFGLAMGPFAMSDLAGLDIAWAARKRQAPTRPKHLRYSRVADQLCQQGRFGQKALAGYFRYEEGSRTPISDPHVEAVIRQCAEEDGIEAREISAEEIVERCMLALINEGSRILGEGIAQRASDIDVVYVDGYGFPAYRGGPMYYAQHLGLKEVLRRIQVLEAKHGEYWTPAPLLVRLVREGKESF